MRALVAAVVGEVLLGRMPGAIGCLGRPESPALCGLPGRGECEVRRHKRRQTRQHTLPGYRMQDEPIDVAGN